jgi:hypothetical protein
MRDAVAAAGWALCAEAAEYSRKFGPLNSWQRSVVLLARSNLERHEDYELGYSDREQVATG